MTQHSAPWVWTGAGLIAIVMANAAGACGGGRAALEAYELTGSGGADAASTTISSSSQGGFNSSSSVGPSTVGPTTTTANVSSSSGIEQCDFTGDCFTCTDCAQNTVCLPELDDCFAVPTCFEFSDCLDSCQGQPGCFPQCMQVYPEGGPLFIALQSCVLCDACPSDCDGSAPPNLCN